MSDTVFFPGLVPAGYPVVAEFLTRVTAGRRRFAEASDVLGYDLLEAYREASINDSELFQNAYLALYLALCDWAEENLGVVPEACGGQSFGGLPAAVRAGVLDVATTVELIHRSTVHEVSYFASLPEPVGCYFFGRLDARQVAGLIAEFTAAGEWVELSVEFENGIHALSATMRTIDRLKARVAELGGYSFHTLTRAEHCSGVAPLRDLVAAEYARLQWRDATIPVVSDIDGTLLRDGDAVRQHLLDGWVVPATWRTIVTGLRAAGTTRAIVVGPKTMFSRAFSEVFQTLAVTPRLALTGTPVTAAAGAPTNGD